jgi:hypothetical protein
MGALLTLALFSALSLLVLVILVFVLCCSKSQTMYDAAPDLGPTVHHGDPLVDTPIAPSEEYPVPPACDPSKIPEGLDFHSPGFVSVTGIMTSTYEYQD